MGRLFLNPKWMTCKIEFSIQISFLEIGIFPVKYSVPPLLPRNSDHWQSAKFQLDQFDRWLGPALVKTLIWILKHSSQIRHAERLFSCGCIEQHGGIASTRIYLQSKEKRYFLLAEERKKQKMFSDILLEYIDSIIGLVSWERHFVVFAWQNDRPPQPRIT